MILNTITSVVIAGALIVSTAVGYAPEPAQPLNLAKQLQIVAHRGYSSIAPENTLAAFQAAVRSNADAIEFDIHMSRDGIPVIMHDDTLDRTTNGKGRVQDKTLAELQQLDAGDQQRIPTLQQTLQAAKGRILYSEIKGYRTPADIGTMVRTIVENGYESRDIMIAFNYQNLLTTRQYSMRITLGFLTADRASFHKALVMAQQDGNAVILAHAKLLLDNPRLLAEARSKGIDVGAWTVDSLDIARKLQALGVTRIITNQLVETLRQ